MRALYERLVGLSGHWKVWVTWALFEGTEVKVGEEEEEEEAEEAGSGVRIVPGIPTKAREIFKRGYDELKARGEVETVRLTLVLIRWANLASVLIMIIASGTTPNLERIRTISWNGS